VRNGTRRHRLDAERIRALYAHARFSIVGVLLSALFFTLFFRQNIDAGILTLWVGVILGITLARLMLVEAFHFKQRQKAIPEEAMAQWERRFYLGVLLSSLSWSVVSLFPFEQAPLQSLIYTALILIAMSSASILTLITSLKMGLTFLSAALLPLIARALLEGGEGFLILASVITAYYLIFTHMAQRLHKAIVDNIGLKLENEELSLKDALTGLWNRRQLQLFVEQLQSQTERSDEPFSIILLDLDHFKHFNDSNGHGAGDEMLLRVAEILSRESRDGDLVVRYGGEEFLLVLPRADTRQAMGVAERIRAEVQAQTRLSISAGIAAYHEQSDFDSLLAQADQALYAAKERGRNRVLDFHTLAEEPV